LIHLSDKIAFNFEEEFRSKNITLITDTKEQFLQADKSRSRNTGGSGIGLVIVKSLVEANGGTIWVKSKLDVGSEFIIALPIKQLKFRTQNTVYSIVKVHRGEFFLPLYALTFFTPSALAMAV